jgi:alcohol dehydrogenase class IV
MKLAGQELMFGQGCLEHLKSVKGSKAVIVTGGSSMKKSGMLQKVIDNLNSAGIESEVFSGVEPDPLFSTVMRGAELMKGFQPDIIVGLGGGSAMDAAKAMWIYYENPEYKNLSDILPPNEFPKLRKKARLICIPSTSGTASEVSRSIVITEDGTHTKFGIGNMEMMPDIAILDPEVTLSMPKGITAETGMDAMTHAVEAWVSTRANYVSDILAEAAIKDIVACLPKVIEDLSNLEYREVMLNASMTAGMAFTNVSLGIVHSMAHTLGSVFSKSHGLLNAILLPYVIDFNSGEAWAKEKYDRLVKAMDLEGDLSAVVRNLNQDMGIPESLDAIIKDEGLFKDKIEYLIDSALADGCTKTNPIIPTREQMRALFFDAYYGKKAGIR